MPGSKITSPFAHLYSQDQINSYGIRQPEVLYSVDQSGRLISGTRNWWEPNATIHWGTPTTIGTPTTGTANQTGTGD